MAEALLASLVLCSTGIKFSRSVHGASFNNANDTGLNEFAIDRSCSLFSFDSQTNPCLRLKHAHAICVTFTIHITLVTA